MTTHLTSPSLVEPALGEQGRVPKYYQLKQRLLEMTREREPGTLLPPERKLAEQFGTSRTTVRQAIQELVIEGRLERFQGRGTYVARPKVVQALQLLTSYTEDMRAQGLEPASRLLDIGYVRADDELAARLAVPRGGRVVRVERLRLADGEPMAIEASHLPAAKFPKLRQHLLKASSLYAALAEAYGVHLAEAEETIETALAEPQVAAMLGVDVGAPLLRLSRHSFDEHGQPIEYVRSLYRGDRFRFVARLRRPRR